MSERLIEAHHSGKVRASVGCASDYFGPRGIKSAAGARVFAAVVARKAAQVLGDPD